MDLEVDFALWVVEDRKLLQRQRTGVDGHAAGIGVDNKAVINVRLLLAKSESLLRTDTRVLFDGSCGDTSIVDNLVLVCNESDFCAGDRRSLGQVEVTRRVLASRFMQFGLWELTCGWSC